MQPPTHTHTTIIYVILYLTTHAPIRCRYVAVLLWNIFVEIIELLMVYFIQVNNDVLKRTTTLERGQRKGKANINKWYNVNSFNIVPN